MLYFKKKVYIYFLENIASFSCRGYYKKTKFSCSILLLFITSTVYNGGAGIL